MNTVKFEVTNVSGVLTSNKCPESKNPNNPKCNDCKTHLDPEFGFCAYGYGAFNRCPNCSKVYDFTEAME